ncbi:integrase [Mesorhizobium sp. VK25A]|uniref:Integrase n=1 Tax=Mesorhizobium vachelliae TaxID=3072309 RepID=A0ABU5AF74_9HYPH|nr:MULTISPECIES: integrase [unclassified Mesorhizobium]MDX8535943.1 integrase [Mesorhizobium sp. VK25D]MDX8548697.1 integrase [Mesorhizobium sp. VK25A]
MDADVTAAPLSAQSDDLPDYELDIWRMPVGAARRPSTAVIDWGFAMPDGSRFTASEWSSLRQAAKAFLWSLHEDPPGSQRRPLSLRSLPSAFRTLRLIILWMAADRTRRFADINEPAIDRLLAALEQRRGNNGGPLAAATVQNCLGLLRMMYLQRAKLSDAPACAPHRKPTRETGIWARPVPLPYTPDPIAIPLISGALRLIDEPADRIIGLRDEMQRIFDNARAEGRARMTARIRMMDALKARLPLLPEWDRPHVTPKGALRQLNFLADRVTDACFVVIAYLIGARVSEILTLKAGCIEHERDEADNKSHAWLVGSIHKAFPYDKGKPHRWIAPEAVQRAIDVMERLSAPLRVISGQNLLWLVQSPLNSVTRTSDAPIRSITGLAINLRLNAHFAPFLGLPAHEGAPWRLTTHQGRKTFARFVGRRDRTGLFALQKHLGHMTRAITDRGYVGTDFELAELIDTHVVEETRHALEEMLLAPRLAGKAGRRLSERSPFRGRTRDGEFDAYVDALLADTGMRLGVCDWGYCLYRQETAACKGNEHGPNPVLRTQSTCAACSNFVVSEKHRPVWAARLARNETLLLRTGLNHESRALVESRIAECRQILTTLNSGAGRNGRD